MIHHTQKGKKRGFTLIELLVVIAIIAILAAILFPVFARARENARRSSCQSNLKQVGLGIIQYRQDYDEKFPQLLVDGKGWAEAIQPYVKSTQLFQCPSESGSTGYTDYWLNSELGGVAEAQLEAQSLTVMNGDGEGSAAAYSFNGNATAVTAAAPAAGAANAKAAITGGQEFGERHLEGVNYSFADGHVKWYKSASKTSLNKIYNSNSVMTTSGQNPTFSVK